MITITSLDGSSSADLVKVFDLPDTDESVEELFGIPEIIDLDVNDESETDITVFVPGPPGEPGIQGPIGLQGDGPTFIPSGSFSMPNLITNHEVMPLIAGTKRQIVFVAGDGGPVTMALPNPDLLLSELWIAGCSDADFVTLPNGGNAILNGDKTLSRGSILKLIALDINTWVQTGRGNGL